MRKDLILHNIISFAISLIIAFVIHFWKRDLMILALPVTILIGAGKELIWDKWLKKGTPEWKDLYCDVWGGLFGTILAYVLCFYFLQ